MENRKSLAILFIGNSHTYYNDMPCMVQALADAAGYDCRVTMIAHGGWYLDQHVREHEVRFNISFGRYDYVVLQEHAHPFDARRFLTAVPGLVAMVREAGSRAVIYGCWAQKNEPDAQPRMDEAHTRAAAENGTLLAPVGEGWWDEARRSDLDFYASDGRHASPAGSAYAAKIIWETIRTDILNL